MNTALICTVVLAAALAGCQTVNTVEREQPEARPEIVNDKRIVQDPSLNRKAKVLDIRQSRVGSNGLLKIEARLYNTTISRKAFNYKFEWVNEEGMTIDSALSTWKQTTLEGKESGSISAVAPSPRAVDFRLKLMEPTSERF